MNKNSQTDIQELILEYNTSRIVFAEEEEEEEEEEEARLVVSLKDITERKQAEAEQSRLWSVLDASLNEIYVFDAQTLRFQYVNPVALRNLGYSGEAIRALTPLDLKLEFNAGSFAELIQPLRHHEREKLVFQTTHCRADGTHYPVEVHLQLVEQGGNPVFLAIINDITERKRDEALLVGEKQVLELIATGAPLGTILDALLRVIEAQSTDLLCSILLLDADGTHLRHAAAPSLPEAYTQAIDGVAIGLNVGSCGTAAFRGEPVIVEDIATDPLWKEYCGLAARHGLRACWSMPIRDAQHRLLGTFAIYHRQPARPTAQHLRLIDTATQTAAIAIGRQRAEEALRSSEEKFQNLFESSPDVIIVATRSGLIHTVNRQAERLFGYSREELIGQPIESLMPRRFSAGHPALRENYVRDPHLRPMGEGRDLFARRKDGSEFPADISLSPITTAQGMMVISTIRDMTARKQAEENLRNSEELYHSLVETLPQNIFRKDLAERFTFANQRFCETLGKPLPEILGKTDFDFFPPTLAAKYQRDDRHVISTGEILETVEENEPPGGGKGYVQVVKTPLHDAAGGIIGLQGIFWDITDQKRAEEALSRAEAKYRGIFENASEGIFQTTPEGKILLANPALVRILGFASSEELIRERTDIARQGYVHPERREEFKRLMAQQSGVSGFEHEVWRKDGAGTVWISATARAIRDADGSIVCYEGTLEDITDRKRSEETLRESEERYRKLIELSPDAIYIHCEDTLVLVNRAAVVLFGASDANELLGHNVLDLVHPDSRALTEGSIRKVQETNATIPVVDKKLLRLDKSSFDAEVRAVPFVFQDKPSGLVIVRDITEKKALNEKLLRNQRLESIGTLAGGIAHDLNNILAPILMSIEILRLKYPETKAESILATIETSAQRGAEMVKQVLTFARGLQGERVTLQISHLIKEIVKVLKPTFPKSIQIRTSIPQELWAVSGDATQLHQVLMNLCVNARDAMPGGGTITLGAENFLIDDNFAGMDPEAKAGPHVIVTVTDTGTGIPLEVRERIFEPFFTTKAVDKGTGLGLATVRGIVKGHGGFVTVYSEVGKGTKFKVYLPAQKSGVTKGGETEQQALPMGKGELILVVDDEAAILYMAKRTLEMLGYEVLTASDGAEATAVCAQNQGKIKLMLTDMMMPIMDGAATVHAVRRIDPNIKIIANSGVGSDVKVTGSQKLGVDAFLHKPYTAETLAKTVRQVLSG